MNKIFSASKDMSHEYCVTVVRIGDVVPVENSDFLATTEVNGRTIVVRKDQVRTGDVMFYASNECQLAGDFLHINNLYEEKTLNADVEAKGYFNKHGRVRMVKLRGVVSMGYLFSLEEMSRYCPMCSSITAEEMSAMVGEDFDTVNGELFVRAYVPPIKEVRNGGGNGNKRDRHIAKFNRMIPGEFKFHYDTSQLERNAHRLSPDQNVTISVKLHGTSAIYGNVLCKNPRWGGLYARVFARLPRWLQFTKPAYNVVYSSRTVIKNSNINAGVKGGYYNKDVWAEYYELLKPYIPEGVTIYGEIVGYVPGSNTMIQKGYDYGCKPGENALMIYRVTEKNETNDGLTKEYNISDVRAFTQALIAVLKITQGEDVAKKIHPIDVLYHGTLAELYPNVARDEHWNENVLKCMKADKEHFGMEMNEPMCRNKTPREGIVLRIDDDAIPEAFKLKCLKFLGKEAEMIDRGETDDIEMAERYAQE